MNYLSLAITLSTLSSKNDAGGVADVVRQGQNRTGHTLHSHRHHRSFTHSYLKIKDKCQWMLMQHFATAITGKKKHVN